MKKSIVAILTVVASLHAYCQGSFLFWNPGAPTRIGTTNGPLAGPGIWAQMLVGQTTDSLIPVGMSVQHIGNGVVILGDVVVVRGLPANTFGFIQMVAWNGTFWGSSLDGVPLDQLGRTDVVPHFFTEEFQAVGAPSFNVPAVVPIPEPSTLALAVLGAGALWLSRRFRKRR